MLLILGDRGNEAKLMLLAKVNFFIIISDKKLSFLFCCILLFVLEIIFFFSIKPDDAFVKACTPLGMVNIFACGAKIVSADDFLDFCASISHKNEEFFKKIAVHSVLRNIFFHIACFILFFLFAIPLILTILYDLFLLISLIFFYAGAIIGSLIGYYGIGWPICKIFGIEGFNRVYIRFFPFYIIATPFYAFYWRFIFINFLWYCVIFPFVYLTAIIKYRKLTLFETEAVNMIKDSFDKDSEEKKAKENISSEPEPDLPMAVQRQPRTFLEHLAVRRKLRQTDKTTKVQKRVFDEIKN